MGDRIELSHDSFEIDARGCCEHIEAFIKESYSSSYKDGIVVPISGGLDSSVVAALCVRAIGNRSVKGLMLPEWLGNPEAVFYGRLIAKHLDIETAMFNISPVLMGLGTLNLFLSAISGRPFWKNIVDKSLQRRGRTAKELYMDALKGELDTASRKLIAGVSSKQRARLLATYRYAEENNLMVAGSAHRTEQMVGLFVKYGIDDGADIMPLRNIYRSQTLQLANYLEIPGAILRRSPNPDILPGITDKYMGYFGMDCVKVELILLGYQNGLTAGDISGQLGIDEKTVSQMFEIIVLSEGSRKHAVAPAPYPSSPGSR